ncbi:MAG: hypothetical protein K6F53_10475 [Lachnospiraceae bacterium]|nr:hypothetical protein [Lachnospiraceae bacterium]
MNKMYEDVKCLVESEIDIISKKTEMSEQDLMSLDKLIDIVKDLHEVEAMETNGYSGKVVMPYYGYIGYDDGNSYGRGGNRNGSNYNQGNYAQNGNSGRNYANSGRNSYGRGYDDDMRMMPERW